MQISGTLWQVTVRKKNWEYIWPPSVSCQYGFLDKLKLHADGATETAKMRDMAVNLKRRAIRERCTQAASTAGEEHPGMWV